MADDIATRELPEHRLDSRESARRMAWHLVAVLYFATGGSVAVIAHSGIVTGLDDPALRVAAPIAAAMGLGYFAVARAAPDERWIHLPAMIAYGMITTVLWMLEPALAVACLGLLALPALGTAFLLSAKHALPYAVLGTALAITVVVEKGEPAISPRSMMIAMAIGGGSVMIAIVRARMVAAIVEFRRIAETDALTGVANLRGLRRALEAAIASGDDRGDEIVVFTVDLDEFKRVNDMMGHATGDLVLLAAARALVDSATPGDTIARRGGDEFVLVSGATATTDLAGRARSIEEAIRAARAQACPTLDDGASVGYVVREPDESIDRLLERADGRQHDVKHESRLRRGAAERVPTGGQSTRGEQTGAGGAARAPAPRPRAGPRAGAGPSPDELATLWRLAAVMTLLAAAVIAALGLAGFDPNMRAPLPLATAGFIGLAGVVFAFQSTRPTQRAHIHAAVITIALSSVALIGSSGASTPMLADAYVTTILFVFLFLPAPQAFPYLVAEMTLYTFFARYHGTEFATVRTIITALVVGITVFTFAHMRRKTALAAALMAGQTETDSLTGIANLRGLRRRLEIELADQRGRETADIALIELDLNDFKSVNDRYSHVVGDAVLVAVARAIDGTIHGDDYCARRGGDEFVVVTLDAHAENVDRLADRVRNAIEFERRRITPDVTPKVTMGVVTARRGENASILMKRADIALHDARVARPAAETADRRSIAGPAPL